MSSSERQGHIGDLESKSKQELCELLLRQEKLLSNKRFIQSLPDKGTKISDFVHRVRLALAHHEEEEKKRVMLSSVRAEFQSKYLQAVTQRQPGNRTDALDVVLSETPQKAHQGTTPTPESVEKQVAYSQAPYAQGNIGTKLNDSASFRASESASDSDAGVSVTSNRTEDRDLADALEKVTLSEDTVRPSRLSTAESSSSVGHNPFGSSAQPQKKTHYVELLQKTELNSTTKRPKFKPNELAHKSDGSTSSSSSPVRSPGRPPQLSADARRERDRKHLDDITSAKLPPLHYSPAQLLSLDESAALQQDQNRKQEELQAKMAAQKLSERLGISMRSYSPEEGQVAGYREVHDNGTQLSSEED